MNNLENIAKRMVEESCNDQFMNPKRIADVIGVQLDSKATRF